MRRGIIAAGAGAMCAAGIVDAAVPTWRVATAWPGPVGLSLLATVVFVAAVGGWLAWGEMNRHVTLAALLWGVAGALFVIDRIEPPLLGVTAHAGGFWPDWHVAIVDAPTEELAKLLGVVVVAVLVSGLRRRPAHLVIAGAIVGTGLQAVENHLDALGAILAAPHDALLAVVVTWVQRTAELGVWLHPADTAIAAVAVAVWGGQLSFTRRRRIAISAGALALAIALHLYWDSPVLRGTGVVNLVFGDLPRVASGLVAVTLVYRRVRRWPSGEAGERRLTSASGSPPAQPPGSRTESSPR